MTTQAVVQSGRFGAAAFDPLDLSPDLWLDASDAGSFTYSSGSFVSQWNDLSGNGRHVSQATAGRYPDRSATVNGLSAVTFDGSNDSLSSADEAARSQPFTVFAVVRPSSTTGNRNILGRTSSGGPTLAVASNKTIVYAGSANVTGATNVGTSTRVLVGYMSGASSWVRVDGGATDGTGNPGTAGYRGFTVGAWFTGQTVDIFAGDVAEIIAVNSTLTNQQLDDCGNYLADKWGTTWTAVS